MEKEIGIFGKKPSVPKEAPVRRANPLIRKPIEVPNRPNHAPARPDVMPVKKPDLVPATR